jgi:hypothetical protein
MQRAVLRVTPLAEQGIAPLGPPLIVALACAVHCRGIIYFLIFS